MATYDYDLVVNGAKISIHHEEKEKEGAKGAREFNPKKAEVLSLKIGQETFKFGSSQFSTKQAAFKLPNFADLNLKWFEAHRVLFPTGATLEQQEAFSRIQEFCKEKGVDLEKAILLLPKTADLSKAKQKLSQNSLIDQKERLEHTAFLDNATVKNIDQKLRALSVICVVLSLKTNHPKSFYNSKIPEDQAAHKKYIDTVLAHFEKGEVKIGVSTKGARFGTAGYVPEWDTFFVSSNFSISSLLDRAAVVHELYHVFQDSTAKEASRKEIEAKAHQKSSEYIIHELGINKDKKVTRNGMEDLIKEKLPKLNEMTFFPVYPALWVDYDRLMKDPKLREDEGRLGLILEFNEYLGITTGQDISAYLQKVINQLQLIRKTYGNEKAKQLTEQAIKDNQDDREKIFLELKGVLQTGQKFYFEEETGRTIRSKTRMYILYTELAFALKRYHELLSGGGTSQGGGKRGIDLEPTRAQNYDLFKDAIDLGLFSKLYGKWEGIH